MLGASWERLEFFMWRWILAQKQDKEKNWACLQSNSIVAALQNWHSQQSAIGSVIFGIFAKKFHKYPAVSHRHYFTFSDTILVTFQLLDIIVHHFWSKRRSCSIDTLKTRQRIRVLQKRVQCSSLLICCSREQSSGHPKTLG